MKRPKPTAGGMPTDPNLRGMIVTDPQGSWTGVPTDRDEVPVQDADDL